MKRPDIKTVVLAVLLIFSFQTMNAQPEKKMIIYQKQLHQKYPTGDRQFKNTDALIINLPSSTGITSSWAISFWTVNHVNNPIGFQLQTSYGESFFKLYNNRISVIDFSEETINEPFKKYWNNFVISYTNTFIELFQNGNLLKRWKVYEPLELSSVLELKGIFSYEPFMNLNDLLKEVIVYNINLSNNDIEELFKSYASALDEGQFPFDDNLFLVDPFASFATSNSVNISWESQNVSSANIRYGEQYPLESEMAVSQKSQIQNVILTKLKPNTNYFAEITTEGNDATPSKVFFKTAPLIKTTFRFGIIGDTESRPFINHRIADNIWDNRPDFFTILGDLTDGGFEGYKEQWTTEFFNGMNSLMSKIPVLPVSGNGDDDLYWFNRYFNPPSQQGFYTYHYANADFFVLRSNQKAELEPGGIQYKWLEEELKNSTADWKFVLLHHAPYSSDEDDYGDSFQGTTSMGDPKVRELIPLFEKYGVDMVFYGHLHCYERSWPIKNNRISTDGIVYIETGGAGGNLEDFAPHRTWFSAKTHRGHHYLMVNINDHQLRMDTYNIEGNLIDTFEIEK